MKKINEENMEKIAGGHLSNIKSIGSYECQNGHKFSLAEYMYEEQKKFLEAASKPGFAGIYVFRGVKYCPKCGADMKTKK